MSTQLTRAAYDSFAEKYDDWNWQAFWRQNELPHIESLIDSAAATGRLLDVGAGTGFYLERFSNRTDFACGLDVSMQMLAVARQRLHDRASLVCADASALPFRAGAFDLVLMVRVATHIRNLDGLAAELSRVLGKRGRLVVSDIAPEHVHDCTEFDASFRRVMVETQKHSIDDWRRAAVDQGLTVSYSASITASNAAWLPDSGFSSIDRSGTRPVGFVLAFEPL